MRTFVENGIPVGNSQDYPSGPMPARIGLWAAVARKTFSGQVICPGERLTVQEALRTYTIWAARHVFMEDRIGSIEVGKYADLVVWEEDLYTVPTERLKDLKVEMTFLEGRLVYKA